MPSLQNGQSGILFCFGKAYFDEFQFLVRLFRITHRLRLARCFDPVFYIVFTYTRLCLYLGRPPTPLS